MRAAVVDAYTGGPGTGRPFDPAPIHLSASVAVPSHGPSDVLIRVAASSVNPVDWKICTGRMREGMALTFPCVPGFDCAGVVAAVGRDCTRLRVGDRVWADVVTRTEGELGSSGGGVRTLDAL